MNFSCSVIGSGRGEQKKESQWEKHESSGRGTEDGSGSKPSLKFEYKFNLDPQNWNLWLALGLAVAAGYILTRPGLNTRHISWQEFRINYLEKGEVDRLEVVNRNVVRVYLRRDAGGGPGVSTVNGPTFNLIWF